MHSRPAIWLALALLLVVTAGGGRSQTTPPDQASAPLPWLGHGVCYGPHRDGQRPGGPAPSAAEIRQDLRLMLPYWQVLRTYGAAGAAETTLQVIRQDGLDLKVMLGVWIAPEATVANQAEIAAACRLANAYPGIVVAVSVGNETQVSWSDHRCDLPDLINAVRAVRNAVSVPVTVADDFSFWLTTGSRELAAEVDFVTVHAHPMWNGLQLSEALPWVQAQLKAVQAVHPGRALVLGETGWATSVDTQGEQAALIKGRPGEEEQRVFWAAIRSWAAATRQNVFFFEAFDENWKGGDRPKEVEKHWGVFRADRSAKAAVQVRP